MRPCFRKSKEEKTDPVRISVRSVLQHLPSMHEILGLIPWHCKRRRRRKRRKKGKGERRKEEEEEKREEEEEKEEEGGGRGGGLLVINVYQ